MKNITNILLVIGLIVIQGCDDTLNQIPDHVISQELVLNSVDKLQNLLTGSYYELSRGDYLGRVLYKRAATKGTDFRFIKTTYNPRDYGITEYKYEESSNSSGQGETLWRQCYKVISNLNLIIENIDAAEGDSDDQQQIKAEALALRGMTYFDLARTFTYPWIKEGAAAQGLPLNLYPSEVVIERSTLGEIYNQIILDMTNSMSLLKNNSWEQGSTKFITKVGVQALLARVYLYKQDWTNAMNAAEAVIAARGEANLMTVTSYNFNDYNSESLFELSITTQNSLGSNGLGAQFDPNEGGQGDVIATQTFVNLINTYTNDPRTSLLGPDREGNTNAFVKYKNRDAGGLSVHNIPIIRLSEIYLIAAEASVNGGGGDAVALNYLNTLIKNRTTDFGTDQATETGEALKTRIAEERRRELALEGHGVFDYIRRGKDINRAAEDHINTGLNANNLNITAFDNRTIYPIPLSEILASGMEQTQGY